MPIPSPADFRNKTKKHSEVREMLAEMAENVASKAYVSNTGFGFISENTRSSINYVTATRTLEFTGEVIVTSATDMYNITTPQSITLPAWTPYRLEYNVDTGLIERIDHKLSPSVGKVSLAIVSATDRTLNTSDFSFTVDGIVQSLPQDGKLITNIASHINFKNASSELIINPAVRLKTPTVSISMLDVAAEDLVINYSGLSGPYNLVFNLQSKKFSFISTIDLPGPNSVIVAICQFVNGQVVDIFGIDVFTSDRVKTYDAQLGELIAPTPSGININTTEKTITFSSTVRVKSPNFTAMPGATTINLPTNIDNFTLIYDIGTGAFRFIFVWDAQPANSVALATFYMGAGSVIRSIVGLHSYQIDGQIVESSPAPSGVITTNNDSTINFDFVNDKLIITSGRLNYADKTVLLELIEVDITPIDSAGFWQRILYSTQTRTFLTKRTSVGLSTGEVPVGMFQKSSKRVVGFPGYYVNGEQPSGGKSDVATAQFLIPFGDLVANYVQPTLPEYKTLLDSFGADHSKIYDLYDALVAQYPDYVSKTVLGQDALGNNLNQYTFKSLDVNTANLGAKQPKIIIFSGMHGWEKAGIMNTYHVLKEICTRWEDDSKLETLRWGVSFVVVPVCNPSGFDASERGTRQNHNGVDLSRNFPQGWAASDPLSPTYGGPAPASEAETVLLDGVLNQNKDALLFISHHNFEGSLVSESQPRGSFLWLISLSNFMQNVAKQHIIKATIDAKKAYTWIPQENDYYIGYADFQVPIGSEGFHANREYGIVNSTFEICDRFHWESGAPKWSSSVATLGAQFLINWLLLNIKHGIDFKNTKINL